MSDAPTAPFFIVGSPRSGTTLLRVIMGRHPRLFIPEETGFLPFLRAPVDVPLSRKQVSAVLRRIGSLDRTWKDVVEDLDAFYDGLPNSRLADVLDALYRMRMSEHGGRRWGDKTPLYVQYMSFIDRLFPDAQFIHVIRDGRDAVVSALEKWGREKAYLDPYYLLKHWVNNVSAGRAAGRELGEDRYLEVYYEDLVTDPDGLMNRVCAFLGESFETPMLVRSDPAGPGVEITPEGPVTAKHVARWTVDMSVFEKKLADDLAGPTLEVFGYPLANIGGFTPAEGVRRTYLAAKFGLTNTIRTLGYRAGILTLNRGGASR